MNGAPDLAVLREVQASAQQGDYARAAAQAQAALDRGLEHPLLFNVIALKLEQDQRLPEAVELLRRGVQIAPRDPGLRNGLGLCLLRLDQAAEARVQFQALLEIDASLPFAHASHGVSLMLLGRFGEAEESYHRALQLDSRQPIAIAGLAHIASRRGHYAEAQRLGEQALELLPGFPDAVLSIAAAELGRGAPGQAARRLRALLAAPGLEAVERAQALGLLGDALDAEGRSAEAFAEYTRCNQTLRRHYARRYASPPSALAWVEAATAELAGQGNWPLRARGAPASASPESAAPPVFVLGFPRSGTTLLEVALEGDPRVSAPGEHEFLIDGVHEFLASPQALARLRDASPAALAPLRAAYWQRAADSGVRIEGRTLLDKNPLNTLKLPLIAGLFPDARVVFVYRDPRDVVFSCYRRRFQMSAPMYELLTVEGAARYYAAVMQYAERCLAILPLAVYRLRYESLVAEFDGEMRNVCAFLGLQFTDAMRDFAPRTRSRTTATPSTAQLARGLDPGGIGSWRRYRPELAPALPLLAPWVRHFDYPSG